MTRNSVSRKRPSSLGRSTQSLNGETIDRKTKQTIFFRTTVCSIAKQTRSSEDAFQEELVGKMLAAQLKKRHAHGAEVLCLEDRLNFKKTKVFSKAPFRNWVRYDEIQHYFVFPGHDTWFMLVIKSNTPGKSLFETYKCKTADETTRLRRLVCQACTDPMKKLRYNTDLNRPYSTVSEVSLHENAISQSNLHDSVGNLEEDECSHHSHQLAAEDESDKEDVFPVVLQEPEKIAVLKDQPPSESYNRIDVRELSPVSFTESNIELSEVHPVMASQMPLPPKPDEDEYSDKVVVVDDDDDGMTYFEYHPQKGAQINNEGPIYMYLKRYAVVRNDMYENGYD